MASNGRKIINSHTKFLDRSREIVGKGYEKYFVLMLRGAETFCKALDPEEDYENFGLTESELKNLSQDQFDDLYKLLLSYFSIVLTGDAIPGSLRDRLSLTNSVVGKEYLNTIMGNINREVGGAELIAAQTENATDQVIQILNTSNPDQEQISQTLIYLGFEYIGKSAINISQNKYCFIATEIYGSYDHQKVKQFRQFRDQYLERSNLGRKIIQVYYKLSPIFIRTEIYKKVLRSPTKKILDTLAKYLSQKS